MNILSPNAAPDTYLCCTFSGSTPSLAPVTSMYHYRSCVGGQLWFWIKLQINIWAIPFDLDLGSTPSLAPVPSMSNLKSCKGLTPDLDPALKPYLCSTFFRVYSISSSGSQLWIHICVLPFVVPLHLQLYLCLTLDHVGVHSKIQIQLKIHICVVL